MNVSRLIVINIIHNYTIKHILFVASDVFHRNIAARNILIKYEKEIMVTKLSDLCLCRGGGANSRYTMESPHSVPAA